MILTTVAQSITRARAEYESKYARRKTADQPEAAVQKFESAEAVEIAAGEDPSTPESSPA
jgi:hypothetical protein